MDAVKLLVPTRGELLVVKMAAQIAASHDRNMARELPPALVWHMADMALRALEA